jgi:hypothetical protein
LLRKVTVHFRILEVWEACTHLGMNILQGPPVSNGHLSLYLLCPSTHPDTVCFTQPYSEQGVAVLTVFKMPVEFFE